MSHPVSPICHELILFFRLTPASAAPSGRRRRAHAARSRGRGASPLGRRAAPLRTAAPPLRHWAFGGGGAAVHRALPPRLPRRRREHVQPELGRALLAGRFGLWRGRGCGGAAWGGGGAVSILIRQHTPPFSPYVAPRFPHMSGVNSLFFVCFSAFAEAARASQDQEGAGAPPLHPAVAPRRLLRLLRLLLLPLPPESELLEGVVVEGLRARAALE